MSSGPLAASDLWTAKDAQAATGGTVAGSWTASGVSIDSRAVKAGDLFVALSGPNFDGHEFAGDALGHGASAAMVARPLNAQNTPPLLVVDDTLEGLGALARFARSRCGARIAAVTGSAGKTGTKEALRLALSQSGPTHASAGSHNNRWGVPLSLARMPADTSYGVFEVGMNHPGEIEPLARMIGPHVAIVTTVEAAHLEFFPDTIAIAGAKAEIFEGLEPGGFAILNRDNQHFKFLAAAAQVRGAEVIGFGIGPRADARVTSQDPGEKSTKVSAEICGRRVAYIVGAPGHHWVMNSLAVLAAVHAIGADLDLAAQAMARVETGSGRGNRLQVTVAGGVFQLIDDSYNANPASVRAALGVLRLTGAERRIVVLGDMGELGEGALELHAGLAPDIISFADLVFTVGSNTLALDEALPAAMRGGHWATSVEAAPEIAAAARPGDAILVKGSNTVGMISVVRALAAGTDQGAVA
jgi:UDP-N-acetylmuramoyl-tripeptide--D-alanyl-D-alanine ligase